MLPHLLVHPLSSLVMQRPEGEVVPRTVVVRRVEPLLETVARLPLLPLGPCLGSACASAPGQCGLGVMMTVTEAMVVVVGGGVAVAVPVVVPLAVAMPMVSPPSSRRPFP
jgi:hypothetical protein